MLPGLRSRCDDPRVVRGIERRRDLPRDAQRLVEGQARRQPRTLRKHVRERLALDQLHDEVVGTDVVQRADVGMIQRRNGACLALEPFGEAFC